MEQAQEKIGIKNCEEVLDFGIGYIDDLAAKKSDDGKIDMMEHGQAALENAPAAFLAVKDITDIKKEVDDLDHEEAKQLAAKGMLLAQSLMKLIAAGKSS